MNLLQMLSVRGTDEEYRTVMAHMVADGRLVVVGERNGEPVYVLTEKGRRYADERLEEAGVSLDEAMAVAYEHGEFDGGGLTLRQIADFGIGSST